MTNDSPETTTRHTRDPSRDMDPNPPDIPDAEERARDVALGHEIPVVSPADESVRQQLWDRYAVDAAVYDTSEGLRSALDMAKALESEGTPDRE
jgi:hypothetical protein